MRRDIDEALKGWPKEPEAGEVLAREVKARDGRSVLQLRIELGVLQLEVAGRPDGQRPEGHETYLEYLRKCSRKTGRRGGASTWKMDAKHCAQADREFVQYYHRRVAWLAVHRYDKALEDAEHTLDLMDFVVKHGLNEEYISSHERLRGLVLFHRTQASAALALERRRPDEAIDALREGADRLALHQKSLAEELDLEDTPDGVLIEQLASLEREIRNSFEVSKTLREQLSEAVEREDYELAARLRDQIRLRTED